MRPVLVACLLLALGCKRKDREAIEIAAPSLTKSSKPTAPEQAKKAEATKTTAEDEVPKLTPAELVKQADKLINRKVLLIGEPTLQPVAVTTRTVERAGRPGNAPSLPVFFFDVPGEGKVMARLGTWLDPFGVLQVAQLCESGARLSRLRTG